VSDAIKEEKTMKLKSIVMMAAVAMVLGACTTTQKKAESCACGAHSAEMAKKDCSSGECPTKKTAAGCAD